MRAGIRRALRGVMLATALGTVLGLTLGTTGAEAATYPRQGQTSSKVTELQRRLVKAKALSSSYITGYYGTRTAAGVRKFQRASRLSQTGRVNAATWRALVRKTGSVSAETSQRLDRRCLNRARALCVDKTRDKLYYVKNSKVVRTMSARFGCASTRTRQGSFRVFRKSRHHVSSIYHTPMPYAMFFSGGQAVHYSADFARRGYAGCSHGCVNIRDRAGIRYVFSQIRLGDRVVVYRS